MIEYTVIFSLSIIGSLVGLSADLVQRFLARRGRNEFIVEGFGRAGSARLAPQTDPTLTFGLILACYGLLALALVCAVPAPLALERTVLTFAVLCVGGLIGEISKSSVTVPADSDAADVPPVARKRPSRRLSLTLALVLNLAFAVLCAGQGIIDIVPASNAKPAANVENPACAQELQPIFVVAQRPDPSHEDRVEPAYQL